MTSDDTLAIGAIGLGKSFGETRAVDGVDLSVRSGAVYGVLGPDGAGKTTTIRMLATLLRPTDGTARVLGDDIVDQADQVRAQVTLTGQLASVDEDVTGRENLIMIARLLGHRHHRRRGRPDPRLPPDGGAHGIVAAVAIVVLFAFGLSWVFTTVGMVLRSPNAAMNSGFMALSPRCSSATAWSIPTPSPVRWRRSSTSTRCRTSSPPRAADGRHLHRRRHPARHRRGGGAVAGLRPLTTRRYRTRG